MINRIRAMQPKSRLFWMILVLFVGACGRGRQDLDTPQEDYDVRIGYLRIGSDLPFFVGQEQGIFERNGIHVIPVRLGDSNLAMEALRNGSLEATDLIGSSVVASAAIDQPELFRVFVLSEATGESDIHRLVVRDGSGVTSVGDLPGRRVAVFPGTQMRAYVRLFFGMLLDSAAVDRIELVPLTPPQQVQAMRDGQVDAALTLEPTGSQLEAEGLGRVLLSNVLFEHLTKPEPFITAFGILRRDWAEGNPQAAAALIEAYREISTFIRRNPAEAKRIMAAALELDTAVTRRTALYNYRVGDDIRPSTVQSTFELMQREGIISQTPSVDTLLAITWITRVP